MVFFPHVHMSFKLDFCVHPGMIKSPMTLLAIDLADKFLINVGEAPLQGSIGYI